jgi:hypothetical protein
MHPQEAWARLTETSRQHEDRARHRHDHAPSEFKDVIKDMSKDLHNAACIDDGHYAKKHFTTTGHGRELDIRIFHGR